VAETAAEAQPTGSPLPQALLTRRDLVGGRVNGGRAAPVRRSSPRPQGRIVALLVDVQHDRSSDSAEAASNDGNRS
jgi:hypothetical protein